MITLNGAVAALLPLVVMLAYRIGLAPSQLLMPVAFAGSAGGLLFLMSSPVNVIVSEAADDAGAGPFSFFAFTVVGIPLLLGTIAISLLVGPRVLPVATPEHAPPDLGRYAETLESQYQLKRRLLPAPGAVPVGADRGDGPRPRVRARSGWWPSSRMRGSRGPTPSTTTTSSS